MTHTRTHGHTHKRTHSYIYCLYTKIICLIEQWIASLVKISSHPGRQNISGKVKNLADCTPIHYPVLQFQMLSVGKIMQHCVWLDNKSERVILIFESIHYKFIITDYTTWQHGGWMVSALWPWNIEVLKSIPTINALKLL